MNAADQSTVIVQNNTVNGQLVPAVTRSRVATRVSVHRALDRHEGVPGQRRCSSRARVLVTGGWLVGGDQPGQGNVMAGLRAGFDLDARQ